MVFLTAEWRDLVMLNYVVEPKTLEGLVPAGTELDFHEGRTFVSIVGFHFLDTRIFGLRFPRHTDFEEINLRFYVRRREGELWRRGVVFVRELVPRRVIAFLARMVYGEPYIALPMNHLVEKTGMKLRARYNWKYAGRWNSLEAVVSGEAAVVEPGSEEEFITEHYWGYTAARKSVMEYQVEHPRWRVWRAESATLDCQVAELYGERFVDSVSVRPSSAFIADGSNVVVHYRRKLPLPFA